MEPESRTVRETKTLAVVTPFGGGREGFERALIPMMARAKCAYEILHGQDTFRWIVALDPAYQRSLEHFDFPGWVESLWGKHGDKNHLRTIALNAAFTTEDVDFIAFADSDDWYPPDYWGWLVNGLTKGLRCAKTGYQRYDVHSHRWLRSPFAHGLCCGVWGADLFGYNTDNEFHLTGYDGRDACALEERASETWLASMLDPVFMVHGRNMASHRDWTATRVVDVEPWAYFADIIRGLTVDSLPDSST